MTVAPSLAPPEFEWRLSFTCEKHPVDVACHELPESSKVPVMFGPNITGVIGNIREGNYAYFSGAFSQGSSTGDSYNGNKNVTGVRGSFSASRSNSVFGSSSSVQPPSVAMLILIKS